MQVRNTVLRSVAAAALAAALAVALGGPSNAAGRAGDDPKPPESSAAGLGAAPVAADQVAGAGLSGPPVSAKVTAASSTIQSRIVTYVKSHGTKYTFGSYTDATTGKVVIQTDAPADVVSSLVGTLGGVADVRKQAVSDSFSRKDDVAPFWGGAGIVLTKGVPRCTSGYSVKNAAGTRFQITAGHCFSNGQTALTELGGRVVGVISGNGLPSRDMEAISGQTYSPFIYTGGVNSSTGAHVASAADPVVGFANYCHSGRTTGEHCGHTVTSVTGTVCTSSGCKSPVIVFTGGTMIQGGDSGAPFYANSASGPDKHIRGHVIASGGSTGYAEKWSRVAARWGVTILT
jgi:hypothetical protein